MPRPYRVGHGSDRSINRGGQAYIGIVAGSSTAAKPFAFPWAGGLIAGTPGEYELWASVDGNPDGQGDPYQVVLDEADNPVTIDVAQNAKKPLPEIMFNGGWYKLVGPNGTLHIFGAG